MAKTLPWRGTSAAAGLLAFSCLTSAALMFSVTSSVQTVVDRAHVHALVSAPDLAKFANQLSGSHYLPNVCEQGMYTWQAERMPLKIFISSDSNVPGYKSEYNDMVRKSFSEWVNIAPDKLSWREVAQRSDADITVDWTTQVKQLPQGTEAGETKALTRLNTKTNRGIIYGARMSFLTQLNGKQFTDNEVFRTCLHEAGHALGLQGHSPSPKDVMFYAISKRYQPVLSDRDRSTMASLYSDSSSTNNLALNSK